MGKEVVEQGISYQIEDLYWINFGIIVRFYEFFIYGKSYIFSLVILKFVSKSEW